MAIQVDYLRDQVRSLAKKDQAGYSTDAEFNQSLRSAELTLYEYYYKQFEATNKILDALEPFIKEVQIPLTNGVGTLPSDEYHRLEVSYLHVVNNCATPKITTVPVDYMQANEVAETLRSFIRRPNIDKKILRHTYKNGALYVYPTTVQEVTYKYLRQPVFGQYVSTFQSNANGDFSVYDPTLSTQLEWPEQETDNFIDLLLFNLGIELRSTEIINFVKLKQKEGLVN